MASSTEALSTNRWDFIPFLTPMLKGDTTEKDGSAFWKRMALVASVALAFFVAAVVYPPFSVLCIFLGLAVLPIPLIDGYLTDKELNRREDRRAIDEYLSETPPSKRASERIRKDLELVEELTAHTEAINKINFIGRRLLTPEVLNGMEPEMELFSLLAKNGYDFLMETELDPVCGFMQVATSPNLEKLRFLLREKIFTPDKLNNEQTVQLWLSLGSLEAGHLLSQYGFNIDPLDENGLSPLYRLILELGNQPQLDSNMRDRCLALFQLYLDLGADTLRTVSLDGVEYHAFQLNHAIQKGGSQLHAEFEKMLIEHHQKLGY